MDELVSIITPSYNSEGYILQTIQSVLDQTYLNWELIIVDDGSSDNTSSIINEVCCVESRIKFLPLKKNGGPAKARNIGIDLAKGKYMTFLDADDIWFPEFIEDSIATIKSSEIPFVFSSYKRADENLEFVYSDFVVPQKVTYKDILKTNSISCLTAFLDIEQLGKKRMPDIYKRQDMGLWLQYLKEIPFALGIPETKAIYRIRKTSLSRNKKNLVGHQWFFYRKVEKLNYFESMYYLSHWMYRGFMKYRN